MRNTIRVLHNGRPYVAGHDDQIDDARLIEFPLASGATDAFAVDWTGFVLGDTISAAWETDAGTLSGETVSGGLATAYLSGLTEGEAAEVVCSIASGSLVNGVRFKVKCGDTL